MNKCRKRPLHQARGLVFWVLFTLMFLCGLAGVARVAAPLCRSAQRWLTVRQARAKWHELLRGGALTDDSPLYNLEIPAANLDFPVLADSGKSNLSRLPCLSAACLDQAHAPVIVAHRDQHFRKLNGVAAGDLVYLTQRDGVRQSYRVRRVRVVSPHAADLMAAGVRYGSLTLITCYPFRYLGPAPDRFVVFCEPS